jgi:hypothetical protein
VRPAIGIAAPLDCGGHRRFGHGTRCIPAQKRRITAAVQRAFAPSDSSSLRSIPPIRRFPSLPNPEKPPCDGGDDDGSFHLQSCYLFAKVITMPSEFQNIFATRLRKRHFIPFVMVCLIICGFPILTWFRAWAADQVWPRSSDSKVGPMIVVDAGRLMVSPAHLFVDRVMTRVDYRYGCAGPWSTVYIVSYCILALGYAGALVFIGVIFQQAYARRRYEAEGRLGSSLTRSTHD